MHVTVDNDDLQLPPGVLYHNNYNIIVIVLVQLVMYFFIHDYYLRRLLQIYLISIIVSLNQNNGQLIIKNYCTLLLTYSGNHTCTKNLINGFTCILQ